MADAVVGLAAAIEALRTELSGAMAAGGGQGMQFALEPIELTVQAVVTVEGRGRSVGRFWSSAAPMNRRSPRR